MGIFSNFFSGKFGRKDSESNPSFSSDEDVKKALSQFGVDKVGSSPTFNSEATGSSPSFPFPSDVNEALEKHGRHEVYPKKQRWTANDGTPPSAASSNDDDDDGYGQRHRHASSTSRVESSREDWRERVRREQEEKLARQEQDAADLMRDFYGRTRARDAELPVRSQEEIDAAMSIYRGYDRHRANWREREERDRDRDFEIER